MKSFQFRPLALCVALALAPAAHAQVARVNGVNIPQARADAFVKELTGQGRPDTPELRNMVREELINRELLAQEAVRRGLDKNVEVAMAIEMSRQNMLVRAYMQEVLRTAKPAEEAMRKEYDRLKTQLGGAREYKARHILVEKEEEAKDIIAQIRNGSSFEKLASERSKDPGSQARGGELDWNIPQNYLKPFGDALAKLKKGQMTEAPVQTNAGWHVIRVDDERQVRVPSYEEFKPNIENQMRQQAQQKALAELRTKAKIE